MKTFVCELCGNTQFTKSNGAFVCNGCNTQFTSNDMRKMIVETPDSETIPAQTPKSAPMPITVTAEEEKPLPKPEQKEKTITKKPKKKISLGMKIGIGATGLLFIFFVVGFIMALDRDNITGNLLLLLGGILDLVIAYVLYKGMMHLERFICPCCGAKREHHREFRYTTKKEKEVQNSFTTYYTHHYHDTYECPECGETFSEFVNKSGGTYRIPAVGDIKDSTRPPREF